MKIRECALFFRGVSFEKNCSSKCPTNNSIPIIRANNIFENHFDFNDLIYVPTSVVNNEQRIYKDDIIITMSSGSKAHVGKVALATNDFDIGYGAFLGKLKPYGILPKYLAYLLQSRMFRNYIEQTSKGTNINNIRQSHILDFDFSCPSFPEQERIVAKIEELFSELDAAVAELKTVKEKLQIYRQAVLEKSFTGNYPLKKLKEISDVKSGAAFKSNKYSPNGKYTIVKIGNVKKFKLDFSKDLSKTDEVIGKNFANFQLKEGDCLITMTGTRGKRDYGFVSMVTNQKNLVLNQRVSAIRFHTNIVLPIFYQYYLCSKTFQDAFFSYETGNVGQGNVGIDAVKEPFVILPSIEKQKAIVEKIEEEYSVCNNIEQTVDTTLQQAAALRQSILKQAFEGKL